VQVFGDLVVELRGRLLTADRWKSKFRWRVVRVIDTVATVAI